MLYLPCGGLGNEWQAQVSIYLLKIRPPEFAKLNSSKCRAIKMNITETKVLPEPFWQRFLLLLKEGCSFMVPLAFRLRHGTQKSTGSVLGTYPLACGRGEEQC